MWACTGDPLWRSEEGGCLFCPFDSAVDKKDVCAYFFIINSKTAEQGGVIRFRFTPYFDWTIPCYAIANFSHNVLTRHFRFNWFEHTTVCLSPPSCAHILACTHNAKHSNLVSWCLSTSPQSSLFKFKQELLLRRFVLFHLNSANTTNLGCEILQLLVFP